MNDKTKLIQEKITSRSSLGTFIDFLLQYADIRVLAIGCIAYANGLPLLLTSKTLGVWLETYGLNYTSIGLFGLMHLPYTCKFLWAPLLDHVRVPFLSNYLGQRRSWLCITQITAILGLFVMVLLDPMDHMFPFFFCGLIVTISAASQHILLLAYQMESLEAYNWGVGESMSVFAFRLAILTGGAGALFLATAFTWQEVYVIITSLMFIGLIAVFLMKEPNQSRESLNMPAESSRWFNHTLIRPFKDFVTQQRWWAILIFMLVYRLPENLLGMMQTLFLIDLGFSYVEIGSVAKIFGLTSSILGSVIAGFSIRSYGFKHTLYWGAIGHGAACFLFIVQAYLGHNISFLYLTIGVEHIFSGLSLTAFFSYQLTCCNIRYAATQIALLTSTASLSRTFASPIAGGLIDSFGWVPYLWFVVLSAIPGIWWVKRIPFSRA